MNNITATILAYESLVYATSHPVSTIKRTDCIIGDIYPICKIPYFTDKSFESFMMTVVEFLKCEQESKKWMVVTTVESYIDWISNFFQYRSKKEIKKAFDLALLVNFSSAHFFSCFYTSYPYTCYRLIMVKREVRQWICLSSS